MAEKKVGFRRISDDSVHQRTGKGWREWFAILDEWGVKETGHTLAAKHLHVHCGVSPWWAQAVVVRYEWERGLGQKR